MRFRRGPATVTGVTIPGSQELSPPVSSNQGVDTLSEDTYRHARLPIPFQHPTSACPSGRLSPWVPVASSRTAPPPV